MKFYYNAFLILSLALLVGCSKPKVKDISTDNIDYLTVNCRGNNPEIYYPLCAQIKETYSAAGVDDPVQFEYHNPLAHLVGQKYSRLQCERVKDIVESRKKMMQAISIASMYGSNIEQSTSKVNQEDNVKYEQYGGVKGVESINVWCNTKYISDSYKKLVEPN